MGLKNRNSVLKRVEKSYRVGVWAARPHLPSQASVEYPFPPGFIAFANTLNFVKNISLRVVFSTLFSVFGEVTNTRSFSTWMTAISESLGKVVTRGGSSRNLSSPTSSDCVTSQKKVCEEAKQTAILKSFWPLNQPSNDVFEHLSEWYRLVSKWWSRGRYNQSSLGIISFLGFSVVVGFFLLPTVRPFSREREREREGDGKQNILWGWPKRTSSGSQKSALQLELTAYGNVSRRRPQAV